MTEPRLTPGGLATQFSSVGHYELADDQAMIITVPAVRTRRTRASSSAACGTSRWTTSTTRPASPPTRPGVDPDGMIRFVISERDPGVANWLETTGHPRGYLQIRWQRCPGSSPPADGPTVEVVGIDQVAAKLPFYEQNKITPEDWTARIAERQAAVANRMLG